MALKILRCNLLIGTWSQGKSRRGGSVGYQSTADVRQISLDAMGQKPPCATATVLRGPEWTC